MLNDIADNYANRTGQPIAKTVRYRAGNHYELKNLYLFTFEEFLRRYLTSTLVWSPDMFQQLI